MSIKPNRIERYYDTHPMEGDELTQSLPHYVVIQYLILVVQWFFHGKRIGVVSNVNFYQTEHPREYAISPDIAIVDGLVTKLPEIGGTSSYYIGRDGPPPRVVFEIASPDTWRKDLEEKPAIYQAIGVSEYFVYDPSEQPIWTKEWRQYNRLIGWRRSAVTGEFMLLSKDAFGRLWSAELDSWLAVEPDGLKLYTDNNQVRLTADEAHLQLAEAEHLRAEAERRIAETAMQQAEVERQRADEQAARAEMLAEMLRKLGHNPDDLL